MAKIKLGIFNLGLITVDTYSLQTIENSILLAQKAELLGYKRYWIGEHHGHDAAWRSPEILLTLLAANTTTIRIGSAGVLLHYHNPLLCAQDYKLLANIFSDRIDLGFARSMVADNEIHELLAEGKQFDLTIFQKKAALVRSLLTTDEKFSFYAPPSTEVFPELWMLGTSLSNFKFALENSMNFSLSLCHGKFNEDELDSLARLMIDQKIRLIDNMAPPFKYNLMVNIICAENDKKAMAIMKDRAHSTLQINFAGCPEKCLEYLLRLQQKFQTDEIIVADACKSNKEKIKSISLLSKIADLTN